MAKISSYGNEGSPKLSDKLIGTSVGGSPVDSTFNFTLESLLSLFSENITLQDVLNSGNTATQDINLTGEINVIEIRTTSINVDGISEFNGSANFNNGAEFNDLVSFNDNVTFFNPTEFLDVLLLPEIQFSGFTVSGERTLKWNDVDGTADLVLKGGNVTLQIGQEQVIRVINGTGAELLQSQYRAVKIIGAQGQRLQVGLAQADSDINSATTIGLVTETIANNQQGFITTEGTINDINTTGSLQGETWVDGDVLYLSPTIPGALTNVKPITPAHLIVVGFVEYAHANNGKIYVKVDNGYELDELHDVRIQNIQNGELLVWNNTNGYWFNDDTMKVDYINGRVGIETDSPSAKLNVHGNLHLGAYSNLSTVNLENRTGKSVFSISTDGVNNAFGTTITYSWSDGGQGPLKFNNASTEVMRITNNGNVSIGNTNDTHKLDVTGAVNAASFKVQALNTAPATATSTGTVGEVRYTSDYIYVCVAANTWKRTPLSTW
jgi:hypothetical protein